MIQFINWKERSHENLQSKLAILTLGKQPCGKIWVLSKDVCINEEGVLSDNDDYVWLNNIVSFVSSPKEVLLEEITCNVMRPLGISSFKVLLSTLEKCLAHNFLSGLLFLGAGAMSFHYRQIADLFEGCPQVMATGPPSTGKTLSMHAALSLFGANNTKNHYNSCSKSFCLQRSAASTIPFAIDDPSFGNDIADIILSFYNGTLSANIAYGGIKPVSCPLYCANFTFGSNRRYQRWYIMFVISLPKVTEIMYSENSVIQHSFLANIIVLIIN